MKSKLSTAKKSKTRTFSRVFHPKNRQFSREIKVEFLDKKWRFRSVCDGKAIVHIFMLMLHVARPGFPWEDARSSMPASRQCWKSGREQGRKQGKNGRFLRDVRVAFARQSVAWGLWVGIFVQPRQDGYEDEIVQSLNPLKWIRYFWELYNMSSAALIFSRHFLKCFLLS